MSNSNGLSLTWSNYVDLENDVVPWLQMDYFDQAATERLQMIIDMACQWVQNFLGRPVGPTTFDRRFDGWAGWNGAFIELPYYPILEITSVTEWWGGSGPHVLLESTPSDQVDGWQCIYESGQLRRVFPGLVQKPWFPGSRNIEVVWTAGFNPLPGDIKMATLQLIAHWWRNTQQAARTNVRAGGESDEVWTTGLWAGTPNQVSELLTPYLQVGLG